MNTCETMLELELWREWVLVVCGWDKIPNPTLQEWENMIKAWWPGKAPIDSVAELKKARQ